MKSFLKNIAVFACILIIGAFLFQAIVSLMIKDKTVFGTETLEITSNVHADVVLMGSSRCWVHFDPAFFKEEYKLDAVNIGMNGHSEITIIRLRLENYLAKNKPPQFAVLNFDPFARIDSINKTENFVMKDQYLRYAFFPTKENLPLVDYFKFTLAEKYVPLYALFKYRYLQYCFFLPSYNPYREFGYWKSEAEWDTIKNPVIPIMKRHYFKEKDRPIVKNQLKQIQDLCIKHNIKLICVQTPVFKVAYDESMFRETGKICEELSIPFVDACIPSIRNELGNFYNSNHMNSKGVKKMNEFLKNEPVFNRTIKGSD